MGPGDIAASGGTPSFPGSLDRASVVGTDSTAVSGSSFTAAGNADLAAAFGGMHNATATGANFLVDFASSILSFHL